jgi:hypothetical protein
MKITYRKITKSQEDRLEPLVARVSRFAPWWCKAITLTVDVMSENTTMSCVTEKPYGFIIIAINEGVIDTYTDDELFDDLLHEISHGYNDEVRLLVDDILPEYIPDEHMAPLRNLFVRAVELDTEALSVTLRGVDDVN